MKLLDTQLHHRGFDLHQISRDGNIAVYTQRQKNLGDKASTAYEVIRIQSHNGRDICGNHYPPAEYYPHSESWGLNGFTFTDKDEAFKKALALVAA